MLLLPITYYKAKQFLVQMPLHRTLDQIQLFMLDYSIR